MPDKLEIKGLSLAVQNTRRSIAVLRAEIAGLNDESWKLQKTVVDLRDQIKATHDDLRFEAENLSNAPAEAVGNGAGHPLLSEHGSEPLKDTGS
jgi:predicted  nucleic acid-binding Zn-ribbon protein